MENDWIGLIPAAGKGIRLGLPYPKELYPIIRENRYKPVSQYILENMTESGIKQVVFVINETKHQLIGYFGDGSRFNCHTSYAVQENREDANSSTSPGLAHALDSAYYLTRNKTVFFGMADTIITPQDVFREIYSTMNETTDAILGLFPTHHPEKVGMVQFDKNNHVEQIIDKPKVTSLKYSWGVIIWQPKFTEFLHDCITNQKIYDFALVMNKAINTGLNFQGIVLHNYSYADLGTYEEIMELEEKQKSL